MAVTVSACVGPQPKPEPTGTPPTQGSANAPTHSVEPGAEPKAALEAFLSAAEKEDFQACYQLLASPLREKYTPIRLGEDFRAVQGLALDKLARARVALAARPRLEQASAEFPISETRAVRLVLESSGWKVAALE
ncbi:MAG: hypothetical protein QM765_06590 [Myxococcales bacterium]